MNSEFIDSIKDILMPDESAAATLHEIEKAITEAERLSFEGKKPGDRFVYRGIEWVILGREQGGVLCVTAEPIERMMFDEDDRNNWTVSSLRRYLNSTFLAKLDKNVLCKFVSGLVADNGDKMYGTTDDYVGLLSCDLCRKYRDVIPHYKTWIWTCTPWVCDPIGAYGVRGVGLSGGLGNSVASIAHDVVPACIFADSTATEEKGE